MKNVQSNRSFKAVAIIIAILIVIIMFTATTGRAVVGDIIGFLTTPVGESVSKLTEDNALTYKELLDRNEKLQQKNDELINQMVDYDTIKQENEQYKTFLEIKEVNPDYKLVKANIIARSPTELFYGFTINQGSLAGIKINDVVITNSGLVGIITQVSSTYAKVSTIYDPLVSVGVIDSHTTDTGVTAGDIQLADSGLIKMKYISAENTMQAGDIIVTTGLGGIYPKNLVVGTVEKVDYEVNDINCYADIKPLVDVKNINYVVVITSFSGQGDVLDGSPEEGIDIVSSEESSDVSSVVSGVNSNEGSEPFGSSEVSSDISPQSSGEENSQ